MQPMINDQKYFPCDSTWYLVAQYLLSEETTGADEWAEPKAGSLLRTLQEVGVPRECLTKLQRTIAETMKGSKMRSFHGGASAPMLIRLFCQKMHAASLGSSDKQSSGGWGFYLIDRGWDSPTLNVNRNPQLVELYLYREGD